MQIKYLVVRLLKGLDKVEAVKRHGLVLLAGGDDFGCLRIIGLRTMQYAIDTTSQVEYVRRSKKWVWHLAIPRLLVLECTPACWRFQNGLWLFGST